MSQRITKLNIGDVPLGPDEYRVLVERAVARFVAAVDGRKRRAIHKILGALESLKRPATYTDVREELGWPNIIATNWQISSRLQYLVRTGNARISRVEPRTHRRKGPHGSFNSVTFNVTLYEFVTYCPAIMAVKAKAQLDRTMDRLDARKALGRCVVSSWSFAGSERNQRMVAERAKGRSLVDIGREHGLSRERVRQVVARAINQRRGLSDV